MWFPHKIFGKAREVPWSKKLHTMNIHAQEYVKLLKNRTLPPLFLGSPIMGYSWHYICLLSLVSYLQNIFFPKCVEHCMAKGFEKTTVAAQKYLNISIGFAIWTYASSNNYKDQTRHWYLGSNLIKNWDWVPRSWLKEILPGHCIPKSSTASVMHVVKATSWLKCRNSFSEISQIWIADVQCKC